MIINIIIKDINMTTQTARTTILTTPNFKIWLADEAKTEGVSVSELVRLRCKAKPNEDELLLKALIKEVRQSTKEAKASLTKGLESANKVLSELRSNKK